MKKHIIAAALCTVAATTISAYAYNTSGFSDVNSLVVIGKTPYDSKYTQVKWNTDTSDFAGIPTAASGGVLLPKGNTITMLSEKDGSVCGTVELNEKTSENFKGAIYGNTYVQPTNTGIVIINAQTMALVSEKNLGAEIASDAAICDNYVYIAAKTDDGCTLFCLDISNSLNTVWEYSVNSEITELSFNKNYIVFGSEQALICCDAKSGTAVKNELGLDIIAPFSDEYAVYLSAQDGSVYKLRLNDDGTIEQNTLTGCEIGGELTRPVVYDGRLYVGSDDGFFILDSLNMTVEYCFDEIKKAYDPLVCVGNGTRIYTVAPLENYYCLYSLYDMSEDEDPSASKLAKLEDFSSGSFTAAQSGTMYFCDATGRVFALCTAEYSILLIIVKLILLLGLLVLIILILRQWVKQRAAKRPPQY